MALLTLISMESSGKTITVAQDGSGDYTTIQDAIDAAYENDTIEVRAGIFTEHILLAKRLNLVGESNSTTIIDGEGTGSVVTIEADWCNLSGFMIRGSGSEDWDRGGIVVKANHVHVFENNCILNDENGIVLSHSSGYNTLEKNTCISNGGCGIKLSESSNNEVQSNTCTNNSDTGVFLYSHSSYNTISHNNCSSNGGRGMWVYMMSRSNIITYNTCDENGAKGIELYQHGEHNEIMYNSFSNNGADGIRIDYYSEDNILSNNDCSNNGKHGIEIKESSRNEIMNSTISYNAGNGIFLWKQRDYYFTNYIVIVNNSCEYNQEHGIFLDDSDSNTITDNTVGYNQCGIYLELSKSNKLRRNICNGNDNTGIRLQSSRMNTLDNNSCDANNHGIYLWKSYECTIINNSCSSNNLSGIGLSTTTSNTLSHNRMSGDSIGIGGSELNNWNTHEIDATNEVNGKPVYYIVDANGVDIPDDAGQVILANCEWMVIENQVFSNGYVGIMTGFSSNITIANNTCSNNTQGIRVFSTSYSSILNNTLSNNEIGMKFYGPSGKASILNSIYGNNFTDSSQYGIDASNNRDQTVNATGNWWGEPSGPYHATRNPNGTGDNITDFVVFDPWIQNMPPVAYIDAISPNPGFQGARILFEGHGEDDGTITTYVWRSSLDEELYNGTDAVFTSTNLSMGSHVIYFKVIDDQGTQSSEVEMALTILKDDERPTLHIITPENNIELTGTVIISGSAYDNAIIIKVEYRLSDSDEWNAVNGTTNWSLEWDTKQVNNGEYTLEFRAYDGKQYSDIQILTIQVNNPADDDDSTFDFLFDKIGPLALIEYLGAIVAISVVGIVVGKKRKNKVKDEVPQGQSPTPLAAPNQFPTPPQSPFTQSPQTPMPGSSPQTAPQSSTLPQNIQSQGSPSLSSPQSTSVPQSMPYASSQSLYTTPPSAPQQFIQSPPPQRTVPQSQLPPSSVPAQSGSSWQCPQCGNAVGAEFIFCLNCGFRRIQ